LEFENKLNVIQSLLSDHSLDALLLRRVSSFAWATCGAASYVNSAVAEGVASLLITPAGRYLITDNIEAPRIEKEENLGGQDWEFRVHLWHEHPGVIEQLVGGLKLGTDAPYPGAVDLSTEIAQLRSRLTLEEADRFRKVNRLAAQAMDAAVRALRPGLTEFEIAGLLGSEAQQRGLLPIVNLIATDERIFNFRHPLPTDKKLERYAMLVLCGRKWGLVANLTRFVHFGSLPAELRQKSEAVARVDAAFIAATRPGRTLGDVFQAGIRAYTQEGYPDEWNLHHQGGTAGYDGRELIATPGIVDPVYNGQAYAWNPSITGTKSEDTFLVGDNRNEILTAIDSWPAISVEVSGQEFERPSILEVS
jgi:Xaa-Pro aminopeptidase